MRDGLLPIGAVAAMTAGAGTALASFDAAMYDVSTPLGNFATQLQSLDIASTSYDFPFDSGSFNTSGYVLEIDTDSDGTPDTELDRTELVSTVHRVNTATTLNQGGDSLALQVGDLIFAYSIRLVQESTTTVTSLAEFQVGGVTFLGSDPLDSSLVKGRGFLTPGVGVDSPLGGTAGDLSSLGEFGGSHDWVWGNSVSEQLDNDESITLLLFTRPALIGDGTANFAGLPGQASGVDPAAEGAPVLIPIAIPSPGAIALGGLAIGVAGWRRARRG